MPPLERGYPFLFINVSGVWCSEYTEPHFVMQARGGYLRLGRSRRWSVARTCRSAGFRCTPENIMRPLELVTVLQRVHPCAWGSPNGRGTRLNFGTALSWGDAQQRRLE
jgi:hypothetical protein